MFNLVYSTPDGQLREAPRLHALAHGGEALPALTPLPAGATLSMLPGCFAVGGDRRGQEQVLQEGWALGALLPIGFTRTALPHYRKKPGTEPLPFFGYTAVAARAGRLYVAAVRTDRTEPWAPHHYNLPSLQRRVEARLSAEGDNRVLAHLSRCALHYSCPTAQNIFHGRWEGGLPCSPACNAQCVGCISWQPGEAPTSPHERITFVPSVEELTAVATGHLRRGPHTVLSFGQGCEGEPLVQGDLIRATIAAVRKHTSGGIFNVNTNGSRPDAVQELCSTGLNSIRVTLFSAHEERYHAYHRPRGYSFADVVETLRRAGAAGCFTSINLLVFPGYTDAVGEMEALVALLRRANVRMVQMRNLNIDPELLQTAVPPPQGERLGIGSMMEALRRELPGLRIGSYTPQDLRA